MALSDYAENAVLDHILGTAAMTAPGQVYIALYTAAPGDAGGGTEVSGGGYVRAAIDFAAAADGSASSSAEVSVTASGADFGTISHWALFDAATGGNMLVHGAFDSSREYLDGDTVIIPAGGITVTAD